VEALPNDGQPYYSGFDASNSGDDRIYDFNSSEYTGDYSAGASDQHADAVACVRTCRGLKYTPTIVIRNARFVDDNQDGQISSRWLSKVIFEVVNTVANLSMTCSPRGGGDGQQAPLYLAQHAVGEDLAWPGYSIHALVKADNRLKMAVPSFVSGHTRVTKPFLRSTELIFRHGSSC
jgi:hypothetical protein